MTHHPYLERAAHVLAAVALALGLLAGMPVLDAMSRAPLARRVENPAAAARVEEGDLVARITVARLDLDAPVYEGVQSRTLASGAGHLPGTALPGEEGGHNPSVIAVPRDAATSALADLEVGERVQMRTPFGLKRYQVRERRIVAPERVRFGSSSRPGVALVTAYPADSIGPAPLRLALLLEPAADAVAVSGGPSGVPRMARALLRTSTRMRPSLRFAAVQAPMAWRNSETRPTGRTARSEYPQASEALPEGR